MKRQIIITIDGPAGVGKSTLGRRLARALGYRYVDSGALYRAVAWQVREAGLDPKNHDSLAHLLANFHPEVAPDAQGFHLRVAGRELGRELRTPEVTQTASLVAAAPAVRRWVGAILHRLPQDGGMVAEGRDLGSVVFPEAQVKFYLDADLAVRAQRRQQEWQGELSSPGLGGTLSDMAARDRRDQNRSLAPLTVAPDAHYLDTTNLAPDEVMAYCLTRIRAILPGGPPDDDEVAPKGS